MVNFDKIKEGDCFVFSDDNWFVINIRGATITLLNFNATDRIKISFESKWFLSKAEKTQPKKNGVGTCMAGDIYA